MRTVAELGTELVPIQSTDQPVSHACFCATGAGLSKLQPPALRLAGVLNGPLPDSELHDLPLTPANNESVVVLEREAGCLRHPVAGRVVDRDVQDGSDRTALPSRVERDSKTLLMSTRLRET